MCSKGGKPTYRGIVANTSFDARTENMLCGNSCRLSINFYHFIQSYCICSGRLYLSSYPVHGLSV